MFTPDSQNVIKNNIKSVIIVEKCGKINNILSVKENDFVILITIIFAFAQTV
ncbi:hypothetical protein H733_0574 [Haemophilus influenzae CGSHiCZ412602]|nr:hypothetical protein H733_0574 [Haemophilus influenzae CGSHiCZ412602]